MTPASRRANGLPSALVFDFDGLILDTEMPEFVSTNEALAPFGLEYPLDEWLRVVGAVEEQDWLVWAEIRLGRAFGTEERTRLRHERRARNHALIAAQEVRPGVVELLDQADRFGIACAIASSAPSTWVEGHLATLGLGHRFSIVRCRDHVARAKPAPDLYHAACDAIGVAPARAVAFEDSFNGAIAAKAAGMWCVVCPNDLTRSQCFDHADRIVYSLTEIRIDSILPASD